MQFDRRRVTIGIAIAIGVLLLLGLAIWGIWGRSSSNIYGDQVVSVKNLVTTTKDLPDNLRNSISNKLYNIIQLNLQSGQTMPKSIDDAFIRSGSEQQTTPNSNNLYRRTFTVDVPSVKQSYEVIYDYSSDAATIASQSDLYLDVQCLDASQLIYGSFSCKNLPNQGEANQDPILAILPYSTLGYTIRASVDETQAVSLIIILYPNNSDYRSGIDAAIAGYKQQALQWIKDQGIDPTKYQITYSY